MKNHLENLLKEFKGKTVAFLGTGKTNMPLIKLFLKYNAKNNIKILVCDELKSNESEDIKKLQSKGIKCLLGKNCLDELDADVIFRSPGVNYNSQKLINIRNRGIEVTSEIEEFFKLKPCKIIAVTGSDGKTTTTTLISNILKNANYKVHLGGNIGSPVLHKIETIAKEDIAVLELSSFQLISLKYSPNIAVITNISPNHLDVHKDMQEYILAKENILKYQNKNSLAVLNLETNSKYNLEKICKGKINFFGCSSNSLKILNGTLEKNGNIYVVTNGLKTFVMKKEDIKIKGQHNLENSLAAICAVNDIVPNSAIIKTLQEFKGVPHRLEFVCTFNGVTYVNDSIATTPTRVIKGALSYFNKKIILIAGGYDKLIPFDTLSAKICEKVKVLILMGDTATKIASAVKNQLDEKECGSLKIFFVENMEKALAKAKLCATNGDFVVLSPACASFGLYKDYIERGEHFKKLAIELK